MKQKKIKGVVKGKVKDIAQLAKKVGADFDKKTIHDFRVAVKTLRSFLRLLRMQYETDSPKIPEKFKRLYHITGAIRDAQLELEKILEHNLPFPAYLNNLHQLIQNREREWKEHYSKKMIRTLDEKLTRLKYEPLPPAALVSFFNNRLAAIDELSKIQFPSDTEVHKVRKLVKDILYNIKIAKEWKAAREQIQNLPEKKLNDIADAIGDYNDERIMAEHLSSFASNITEIEEKNSIQVFCEEEAKRLTARKKSIIITVKELNELKNTDSR
jgi:CHAD domain-containing protein